MKKIRNIFDRALIMMGVFIMTTVNAYAESDSTSTASTLVDKVIYIFYAVFAIWGLFSLIPGIAGISKIATDDDPQAKKKAQNQIIEGIILLAIPALVAGLSIDDYVKGLLSQAGL